MTAFINKENWFSKEDKDIFYNYRDTTNIHIEVLKKVEQGIINVNELALYFYLSYSNQPKDNEHILKAFYNCPGFSCERDIQKMVKRLKDEGIITKKFYKNKKSFIYPLHIEGQYIQVQNEVLRRVLGGSLCTNDLAVYCFLNTTSDEFNPLPCGVAKVFKACKGVKNRKIVGKCYKNLTELGFIDYRLETIADITTAHIKVNQMPGLNDVERFIYDTYDISNTTINRNDISTTNNRTDLHISGKVFMNDVYI